MVPIVAVESLKSVQATSPNKVVPPRLPAARPAIGPARHTARHTNTRNQLQLIVAITQPPRRAAIR